MISVRFSREIRNSNERNEYADYFNEFYSSIVISNGLENVREFRKTREIINYQLDRTN